MNVFASEVVHSEEVSRQDPLVVDLHGAEEVF
jgi:hypothetical protein